MKKDLISIIVPIYKSQLYLDRCVTSILNQSYKNFELWLVDDCSPDDSGAICDKWATTDARIQVIHQEKNSGTAAARNAALDAIKQRQEAEYIAFVDSDDYIHPTYLERLLSLCKSNGSEISWVGVHNVNEQTQLFFYENDNEFIPQPLTMETKQLLLDEKQRIMYSMVWGKLFKAYLWDNVRMPISCRYYQDGASTFRALYQSKNITISKEKLYYYYYSPNSAIRSTMTEEKCRNGLFTATEKINFYKSKSEKELLEMAYVGYANTILNNLERSKYLPNAKDFYKEMFSLYKSVYKRVVRNKLLPRSQRLKYVIYRICPSFRTIYIHLKCKIKKY